MCDYLYGGIKKAVLMSDAFGDNVYITWKGRARHSSMLGGFVTIVMYGFILGYLVWRIELFTDKTRDEYYFTNYYKNINELDS